MALRRVRTGKTSYLNLNDADYKAWKADGNREYDAADDTGVDLAEEQAHQDAAGEGKAADAPAENKARSAPAEKKGR